MSKANKVYLGFCENYNTDSVKKVILEGIQAIGENPSGRITIKPNTVLAHPKSSANSFTRKEFLDAMMSAVEVLSESPTFSIVERSGVRISTKKQFKYAGYYKLKKKHNVKLEPMEKSETIKVKLEKGVLHDEITVHKSLVDCDYLIYAPKFKFNILVNGITGALKLNIGILDDEERMQFHDMRLDQKIVDLHEVGKPNLIIFDGIIAGHGGSQLTSMPYNMHLILIGNNSVAIDTVANWIINHDPKQIGHLIEANKRGYGPINLEEIELFGKDIKFFQDKAKDFDKGYVKVDEFDTNIEILIGDGEVDDTVGYCMGGCHGILLDALLMSRDRHPDNPKKMNPNIKLVVGKYHKDVESKIVILIGDCTEVLGELKAKRVIKVPGCPPTHRDLLIHLALDAGLYPELLRMTLIIPQLSYFIPQMFKRLHRVQAYKSIPQALRHW